MHRQDSKAWPLAHVGSLFLLEDSETCHGVSVRVWGGGHMAEQLPWTQQSLQQPPGIAGQVMEVLEVPWPDGEGHLELSVTMVCRLRRWLRQ